MDDASRDLVLWLTRVEASRPCLVCITRRPQGGDFADLSVEGHVQLALGPIDAQAAQSLALAAAGEVAVSDEVLAAVVERAGGNPLFVRELVAASRGASDVSSLPDSVETLILTRMDTLAPEDRFLLRNASVFGTRFELDLLARIVEEELPDAGNLARWERLAEFVVWEGAGRLHFVHDLFRAVAYEGSVVQAPCRDPRPHRRCARGAGARSDRRPRRAALAALPPRRRAREGLEVLGARGPARAGPVGQRRGGGVVRACAGRGGGRRRDARPRSPTWRRRSATSRSSPRATKRRRPRTNARARPSRTTRSRSRTCSGRKASSTSAAGAIRTRSSGTDARSSVLDGAEDTVERVRSRADVELAYAGVKLRQGQFDEARTWAERAAASAEAGADRVRLAHAYNLSHIAAVHSGQRAPEHRDKALAILEEVGDLVRLLEPAEQRGHRGVLRRALGRRARLVPAERRVGRARR